MNAGEDSEEIVKFVNLALDQKDRAGICNILEEIARATDSSGAILWEVDPDIPRDDPDARLFTAGHWFRSGTPFATHVLSLPRSFAGSAIRSNRTETTNDMANDPRSAKTPAALEFFEAYGIVRSLATPVHLSEKPKDDIDSREPVGVITIFRPAEEPEFEDNIEPLLSYFCNLLPGLQDSLHHKVSFGLIEKVKDILRNAEDGVSNPAPVWLSVCEAIQECFQLIEASIFLEDSVKEPGEFKLMATTCKDYISREMYRVNEPGLTSWVVTNQKPIRIRDLRYFERRKEKTLIEQRHPGLTSHDLLDIEDKTAHLLKVDRDHIPPLSFIAEPVFVGTKICGALRCCTAKNAPYYFTPRETELLTLIAAQVGQFWTRWLDRRTVREENLAWGGLVTYITSLNDCASSELREQDPNVLNVFQKGLDATAAMIPNGEIVDIRLVDPDADELYFALTRGDAWTPEKRHIRFSATKKPPTSAGSGVYQKGKTEMIPDVQAHAHYREIFTNAKAMIIAPIRTGNKTYGLIDVRNTGRSEFPVYAQDITTLLGQQLGLYYELIDNQRRLSKQTEITAQAFADWQHQIRGPINQSHMRLKDLIRAQFGGYGSAPPYLKIQQGLLRKAQRASQSLRLFLDLANGETLRPDYHNIERVELAKTLLETCHDNMMLTSKRRQISFNVNQDSFHILEAKPLSADPKLLEQAINNVIDNAFKYSYPRTMIEMNAFSMKPFFCIAISNEGVELSKEDVEKGRTRGWRAEQAESVAGEGSGIGLWIVDNIMKAHRGRLELLPTEKNRTVVRLLFPWK